MSFIGGSISFYFAGPIIQKFKALNTVIINSAVSRLLNLLALIFPTIASPAIMSATSLAYGSSEVAKNTLLQKEFSDEQRATLGSINSLAGSILFGIVSFGLGLFADKIGPLKALIIINILLIIPILLLWKLFHHERN